MIQSAVSLLKNIVSESWTLAESKNVFSNEDKENINYSNQTQK